MLLLFSAALSFTACKDGDDDTTPTAKNIVETAQATSDLSSLVAALQRADLVTTLNGAGPFTVFAPTNAAFAAFASQWFQQIGRCASCNLENDLAEPRSERRSESRSSTNCRVCQLFGNKDWCHYQLSDQPICAERYRRKNK